MVTVLVNEEPIEVTTGISRLDVHRAYHEEGAPVNCGFSAAVEIRGETKIEIFIANQSEKRIFEITVQFDPEKKLSDVYNTEVGINYSRHQVLMQNKSTYYYELAAESHKHEDGDPRLVAFYLPQFHPFEVNDKAWGKGFTEWTNVTRGLPRFVGHEQPFLPADLGFYDLRREDALKEQIDLAKNNAIYGFCFYYYWFSGNKLMDMPLNNLLKNQSWDFNFMICWANENWTKRWDGRSNDVIIAQEDNPDDPLLFIQDVAPILMDKRYIRKNGKPVLVVYRASELKNAKSQAALWREYMKNEHNTEIHLMSCLGFEDVDPRTYGFDEGIDFSPQSAFHKTKAFKDNRYPFADVSTKLIDINFRGQVVNYRDIALNEKLDNYFDFPTSPCVNPGWDNDARKKGSGFVMKGYNPDIYEIWLRRTVKKTMSKRGSGQELIFVNAWNEWAEGTALEPSQSFGHALLNRTSRAVKGAKLKARIDDRTAVIVHLYYKDRWGDIVRHLNKMDKKEFKLYVSLPIKDADFESEIKKGFPDAITIVVPNRGRDVLPSLKLTKIALSNGHKVFLKLHSKKSLHRQDGSEWLEDMLTKLIPASGSTRKDIKNVITGEGWLVGPSDHLVSLDESAHLGSNKEQLCWLLEQLELGKKINITTYGILPEQCSGFPQR